MPTPPAATVKAPQGEMETTAGRHIWAEVLKLDRVGRHDNFFELGGHSLLAITLIERMRRHQLQIDVRSLFARPTLAELAMTVSRNIDTVEVPLNLIHVEHRGRNSKSEVEIRLWTLFGCITYRAW